MGLGGGLGLGFGGGLGLGLGGGLGVRDVARTATERGPLTSS